MGPTFSASFSKSVYPFSSAHESLVYDVALHILQSTPDGWTLYYLFVDHKTALLERKSFTEYVMVLDLDVDV